MHNPQSVPIWEHTKDLVVDQGQGKPWLPSGEDSALQETHRAVLRRATEDRLRRGPEKVGSASSHQPSELVLVRGTPAQDTHRLEVVLGVKTHEFRVDFYFKPFTSFHQFRAHQFGRTLSKTVFSAEVRLPHLRRTHALRSAWAVHVGGGNGRILLGRLALLVPTE